MGGGWDECGGWNGGESGGIEVAEVERGGGLWRAVMGDGKDDARVEAGLFIGGCC